MGGNGCGVEVSTRPYWMGVDQYDPCLCVLDKGHGDDHQCSHGITK